MSILPEPNNQFTGNSAALADTARNLARTLQTAPASEAKHVAIFRKALSIAAGNIASLLDTKSAEPEQSSSALEYIEWAAIPLTMAPPLVPPNIAVVVNTFGKSWLPDTLIYLSPSDWNEIALVRHAREHFLAQFSQIQVDKEPLILKLMCPLRLQDDVLLVGPLIAEALLSSSNEGTEGDTYHLLATETFGPALFLSLAEHALRNAPYELSDGNKYQIFVAYHALILLGWKENSHIWPFIEHYYEKLSQVNTWAADFKPGEQEQLWSPPTFETQRKIPQQALGLRKFTPADFDRDVPKLWERLRNLMPPNDLEMDSVESAQPADPISILNAGWSFYLLHMDELYTVLNAKTPEDRYEAKQVLNRLLTKGIELSQITRQWQAAK